MGYSLMRNRNTLLRAEQGLFASCGSRAFETAYRVCDG